MQDWILEAVNKEISTQGIHKSFVNFETSMFVTKENNLIWERDVHYWELTTERKKRYSLTWKKKLVF